ncbi:hypothetical protein D3C85_954120 [compost metagenome]
MPWKTCLPKWRRHDCRGPFARTGPALRRTRSRGPPPTGGEAQGPGDDPGEPADSAAPGRPGPRRRVLRPTPSVGHLAAGPAVRGLQPGRCAASGGRTGPGRVADRAERPGGPSRNTPHLLRRVRRRAAASHPAGGAAAAGRAGPAGRRRSRGRPAPGPGNGRATCLRPAPGPAAARESGASGRAAPCTAAGAAPHHFGRLVDADPARRADPVLRRPGGRAFARTRRLAGAIRRLRAVAAQLAGGRGGRASAGLLAPDAGGAAADPRTARRPRTPGGNELPWREPRLRTGCGARRTFEGRRRRQWRQPVHVAAGSLQGPAAPLYRPGRTAGGRAGGQPAAPGSAGTDRLLRQHPGPAHRSSGTPAVPHAAGRGKARRSRSPGVPGPALRRTGGRPGRRAQPQSKSAVPGHVQP